MSDLVVKAAIHEFSKSLLIIAVMMIINTIWHSATRKEALLAKMRVDPETYMQEPEDTKVHQTFIASFSIQEYTDEIASLLKQHTDLETMMHELGM